MVAIMDKSGHHRALRSRDTTANPRSRFCSLHLRRVCGNCAHFKGDMRTASHAPEARDTCTYFDLEVHTRRPANGCHRWTRKVVAHD